MKNEADQHALPRERTESPGDKLDFLKLKTILDLDEADALVWVNRQPCVKDALGMEYSFVEERIAGTVHFLRLTAHPNGGLKATQGRDEEEKEKKADKSLQAH